MKKAQSKRDDDGFPWLWIVILIVFGLLIWLYVMAQQAVRGNGAKQDDKTERLEWLKHRQKKLKRIVSKKKLKKSWLDWGFRIAYITTRCMIVLLWILFTYYAKLCYEKPTLENYLAWNAAGAIVLSAVAFLFFGSVTNVLTALKKVKPTVETWVYGKYLGIHDAIKADEQEIDRIDQEMTELNNQN